MHAMTWVNIHDLCTYLAAGRKKNTQGHRKHATRQYPAGLSQRLWRRRLIKRECFENDEGLAAPAVAVAHRRLLPQKQRQGNGSGIVTSDHTVHAFVCQMPTSGGRVVLLPGNPGRKSEEEERLKLPLWRGPVCRVCSAAGG